MIKYGKFKPLQWLASKHRQADLKPSDMPVLYLQSCPCGRIGRPGYVCPAWQAPNGVAAIPATVIAPCPTQRRRTASPTVPALEGSRSPYAGAQGQNHALRRPSSLLQPYVCFCCVLPPFRDVISAIFWNSSRISG